MNSDPGSIQPLIGHGILILFLTLIHALFAAAEIAFVSLNHTKMIERSLEGDKNAKRVLRLLEDSDDFLTTIQVVLVLAALFISAVASFHFTEYVANFLGSFQAARTVSMVLITLLIAFVMIVFGEMFPKAIAVQMPDETAMNTAGFILLTRRLFIPIIWLLSKATNGLKRIVPIDFEANDETMTRDEFRSFLEQSHQHEVIDMDEFSMLKGVLSLDNKIAREVMVPRTDAFMLDYDDPNVENIEAMLNSPHSRVPLYFEDKDNVLGIVHVKNLLQASKEKALFDIDLKDIINEALFVPETIYMDDLIFQMRRTHNQMAVLNDEYGGVVGIVTLEDLLEEIVGEIDDEYDESSQLIHQVNEKEWIVDGGTPLDKFNDFFHVEVDSEGVDTIAGYFITEYGNIPSKGEEAVVRVHQLLLRVESVEGSRIVSLHVQKETIEEILEETTTEKD